MSSGQAFDAYSNSPLLRKRPFRTLAAIRSQYCGTYGAEEITSGFSEFLGYFMPHKVITGNETMPPIRSYSSRSGAGIGLGRRSGDIPVACRATTHSTRFDVSRFRPLEENVPLVFCEVRTGPLRRPRDPQLRPADCT